MNDRNWIGELSSFLQENFLRFSHAPVQPQPVNELRINPPLTREEARQFLCGLESGLFRFDEEGWVRNISLRPENALPLRIFSPPPSHLVRETICQLATYSSLVIERGWPSAQIKAAVDEAALSGIDMIIESSAGALLSAIEVKRSAHELQKFMSDFRQCCRRGAHARAECAFQQNHGVFEFCARQQPRFLWLVAPEADRCFELSYAQALIEVEELETLPRRSHIEFRLNQ